MTNNKFNFNKKENLDKEELELLNDLNNGLYEEVNDNKLKKSIIESAKNYKKVKMNNKKDGVFTIRTNKKIMEKFKKRAQEEGINYQTLLNLIVFQYANNNLNLKIEIE